MFYILLACLVVAISAQRPTYAGSGPIGIPQLASRFRDNSSTTSTASTTTTSGPGVANRNGADDASTSTTTTAKLPVDARGDADLVNRISQWPRENQPFWFINADHIEKHRNPQATTEPSQNNLARQQPSSTTPFIPISQSATRNNNIQRNREIPVWEPSQENINRSRQQRRPDFK